MNRILPFALLSLFSVAALAEDTYELKLEWTPKAGAKCDVQATENQKMAVEVIVNGEVVNEQKGDEKETIDSSEEVLKVENGKVQEKKISFSKAVKLVGEEETTYGFEGKTVLARRGSDGKFAYTYEDGSEVAEEDLKALRGAVVDGKNDTDQPGFSEVMAPGKPVKEGETWNPDIKKVVASMDNSDNFDVEKSKAKMTLVKVEKKDGVLWGQIEGELDLVATKMGEGARALPLDDPITMKMTVELNVCIDGQVQDGTLKMKLRIDGESGITIPQAESASVKMDMKMSGTKTITSKK